MPLPIQLGSLTDRLRNLFRIRGKATFSLDEIVVPTVQVQDLTKGPYQAGVTPGAGTLIVTNEVAGGSQMAILLNPNAVALDDPLTPELSFLGRSWTFDFIEVVSRGSALNNMGAFLVPRTNVASFLPDAIANALEIQEGNGLRTVPVVLASSAAGLFTAPTAQRFHRFQLSAQGVHDFQYKLEGRNQNITIGPGQAVVIESTSGPTGQSSLFVNIRGFYQLQPS